MVAVGAAALVVVGVDSVPVAPNLPSGQKGGAYDPEIAASFRGLDLVSFFLTSVFRSRSFPLLEILLLAEGSSTSSFWLHTDELNQERTEEKKTITLLFC